MAIAPSVPLPEGEGEDEAGHDIDAPGENEVEVHRFPRPFKKAGRMINLPLCDGLRRQNLSATGRRWMCATLGNVGLGEPELLAATEHSGFEGGGSGRWPWRIASAGNSSTGRFRTRPFLCVIAAITDDARIQPICFWEPVRRTWLICARRVATHRPLPGMVGSRRTRN